MGGNAQTFLQSIDLRVFVVSYEINRPFASLFRRDVKVAATLFLNPDLVRFLLRNRSKKSLGSSL
jgi:hypothetical protein